MTWSIQVETGENPVWFVGITGDMIAAARGNTGRDKVQDVSRTVAEQERHSLKGNIGELAVQEILISGDDASRWEYIDESETDLLRDESLKLDVKTRDLAHSQGHLLCRRRYIHLNCGGALDMDDDHRCVKCGETDVKLYYREEMKSDMYLLVLLPFLGGHTAEVPEDVAFAHKMGLLSDDEVKSHDEVEVIEIEEAFPLEFAVVVGMASKTKAKASPWLEGEWIPDDSHEIKQSNLNDASAILGWA